MTDLVQRLRKAATTRARGGPAWADYADAADEIERLRARVTDLEHSNQMGCETPADGCDCAGCTYARATWD
jgi:hypothetical protein